MVRTPACLALLAGVLAITKLPNTEVKLGVVVEEKWIRKYDLTAPQIQGILASDVAAADESLKHGEIEIVLIEADRDPKYFGAGIYITGLFFTVP